jgi:hypothetical protein
MNGSVRCCIHVNYCFIRILLPDTLHKGTLYRLTAGAVSCSGYVVEA